MRALLLAIVLLAACGGGSTVPDAGGFTCSGETCDPSTQYCFLRQSGERALVPGCESLPAGCHDCNCALAGFPASNCALTVSCAIDGDNITLTCPQP